MTYDIQNILINLTQEKEQLIKELEEIAIHHSDTDDWEVKTDAASLSEADPSLQADAAEAADERIATLAEIETRYRNIVRALNKIEAGTYGRCEISGEEIEAERLLANPAARTCMAHLDEESTLPL